MKKSKWVVACIVVLTMLISACGGNTNNASNQSQGANNPVTSDSASEQQTNQEVTLRVTSWVPEMKPAMEKIGELFTAENPGVTVDFSIIPGDQYENITKTKLLANDGPDLFFMFTSRVDELANNGLIGDMNDMAFFDRLLPGFQKYSSDGNLYALPVDYSSYGVFYNREVFERLNLTPPTTYEQFLEVSEQIKSAGIEPIALGAKDMWTLENMLYPIYASLTKIERPNISVELYEGKAKYTDAAFQRPFQAFAELVDKGYVNKGAMGIDFQQAVTSVIEGETAMIVTGSFVVGTAETIDPSANFGYFPFPAIEQDPAIFMFVDKSLAYNKQGKNIELSQKFVEFFARPDVMKIHIEELNSIPTLVDTGAELPQALLELGESATTSHSFTQGLYIPGRVYQMVNEKLLPEIVTGKGTWEARFEEMEALLAEELQNEKVIVPIPEE